MCVSGAKKVKMYIVAGLPDDTTNTSEPTYYMGYNDKEKKPTELY